MPALLSRHNLVRTRDLDEARSRIADVFCPHHLAVTRRGARLDTVHNGRKRGAVGLNYLRYGTEVRITPGTMDTFYLVQIPLAGTASVQVGRDEVASTPTRASVTSPTLATDMIWSDDCEQLLVYLSRDAVGDYARDVLGDTSGRAVRFAPHLDLTDPAVKSWLRLVNWLRDDIDDGADISGSPIISSQLETMVIGGLFDIQANTVALPRRRERTPSTRCVDIARQAMESDPGHPWTAPELARVAHVSVRSLQEAFSRDLQSTPMAVLRSVRLEAAHRTLSMADATETTVSETALQWGFSHFGRFSALYRATYGESPSQTLARC